MSKLKRTLLHALLFACFAVMPVAGFGAVNGEHPEEMKKMEHPEKPHVEKTSARFNFGVYYGRPYYYRPYYYYYPYRPYYYRYRYSPYRYYRW